MITSSLGLDLCTNSPMRNPTTIDANMRRSWAFLFSILEQLLQLLTHANPAMLISLKGTSISEYEDHLLAWSMWVELPISTPMAWLPPSIISMWRQLFKSPCAPLGGRKEHERSYHGERRKTTIDSTEPLDCLLAHASMQIYKGVRWGFYAVLAVPIIFTVKADSTIQ